jgi:hypothetical protein
MVDEELVYEYLEHHGVKGMRWGSRKARTSSVKTSRPASRPVVLQVERAPVHHPMSKKQVGAVAAVALGSAFVAKQLNLNIPAAAALGLAAGSITGAIIDRNKDKKLSEL